MAKVKIKAFVHVHSYSSREKPEYVVFPFDMSGHGNVLIGEQEIEVEVPDSFDIRTGLVANLERKKAQLQAEFGKRVTEINRQIQSLLAIEA